MPHGGGGTISSPLTPSRGGGGWSRCGSRERRGDRRLGLHQTASEPLVALPEDQGRLEGMVIHSNITVFMNNLG